MLAKSLIISMLAALLGPTIGVGIFLTANRHYWDGQATSFSPSAREVEQVTQPGHAEVTRTFAPPEPWVNPASIGAQERKPETAAAALPSPELASWHTVVSCPEDQPLAEDGRCPSPKLVSERSTDKDSIANSPRAAGRVGSGEIDILGPAPSSPLPGRMSVGAPSAARH
jgi:hypothetical protein